MENELTLKGDWWLPSTPDIKVRGEAVYTLGEGITLVLEGQLLEESPRFGSSKFINPEIILGFSTTGKEVTLRKCLQTGARQSFFGDVHETTFHVTMMFVGCHFLTEESVKFRGFTIQYANLNYWMNKRGISTDYKDGVYTANCFQPEDTKFEVGDLMGSFSISVSFLDNMESVNIVEKGLVKTWSDKGLPADEHFQFFKHIQDFLTFAILKPTLPLRIEGFTDTKIEKLTSGKEDHVPIGVYYPVAARISKPSKVHPSNMLFNLSLVEARIQDLVQKWISRSEILQPVYNLYFSTLYNPQVYSELKFLTLAQAVETYHRRVFGGKYQTDEQYLDGLYRTLVSALPADIDRDFRDSLKNGKLRYANEYSFRKRLELLTAHVAKIVPLTFIESGNRQKEFAQRVSDTRNYLTHYSPELKEKSASTGKEYYELTDKLRSLIEICLLEEMGFEAGTISELVKKNRRFEVYLRSR
jgi:hypothetical protein